MEKKLSDVDQVKIKNLLTQVKQHMDSMEFSKHEVYKMVNEINEIINVRDEDLSHRSI